MDAPTARVIRNKNQIIIPAEDLVVGDIVLLESGMRVPADARLIDTNSLLVDESMLTGESFAINKKYDAILSESAPLGDRITMVYSGTIIQKGRATGVVTAVGKHTEFGKISEKVAEAEETVSPLQIQIAKFGKGLSIGILLIVIAIFIVGFLRGYEWITMFMTSVGLAVSAIPEGLPVAVTITLSIGIYQMAKHKAIVKKLAAVETLGSTNVICTDKTGTLTKNQMTVTRIFAGGEEYDVVGSGYQKDGFVKPKNSESKVFATDNKSLEMVAFVGSLCTETTMIENGAEWELTGDPTEGALMIAANKLKYDVNNFKVYMDIPFESENQLMAVRVEKNEKSYMLAKGAPEKILARCKNMIDKNGCEIDIEQSIIETEIANFSKDGLRVLALAYSEKCCKEPLNLNNLNELTFVGFAGIEDAVRPEAVDSVKECHSAGIKVVMITGDHAKTAQAVAKSVGIGVDKPEPIAVTGIELDKMTDDELAERSKEIDVYARVAPHHKYRIVKKIQGNNNIVAMTGDGVNDAPALKQADIGVAMGSGSDVAKEAASMVLMDDNFATIVKAVRRGRVVLKNLQHIMLYILATSFGGLLTIAISVAIGMPLPVLPAQLLWINLVTDGTSTFPLAFEKEHGNVMVFPPRQKDAPLINKEIIYRIIGAGALMMIGTLGVFYYTDPQVFDYIGTALTETQKLSLAKAQTMAFCTLAFFQIWNVQNSRSLNRSLFFNLPAPGIPGKKIDKNDILDRISPVQNPILIGIMLLAIVLQVGSVELPFMNLLLNTVNLNFEDWYVIIGVSFSIIIFTEFIKFVSAYRQNKKI